MGYGGAKADERRSTGTGRAKGRAISNIVSPCHPSPAFTCVQRKGGPFRAGQGRLPQFNYTTRARAISQAGGKAVTLATAETRAPYQSV